MENITENNQQIPMEKTTITDTGQGEGLSHYGSNTEQALIDILVKFSASVLSAPFDLLDREIEQGLQEVNVFFGCDRVVLWEVSADGRRVERTHSFTGTGDGPPLGKPCLQTLPFVLGTILQHKSLSVSRLQDLPEDAQIDTEWLRNAGLKSFVVIPLIVDSTLRGVLSLACVQSEYDWSNQDVFDIQRISSVFSGALDRKRYHQLLQQRVQFETLITDLSARLIKAQPLDIDRNIEQALHQVREFFKGDRCFLLGIREDRKLCWVSHASYAEGIQPVSGDINLADMFPWSYEQLVIQRQAKNVARKADLPPQAEVEVAAWSAMGILSALSVPIEVEGIVSAIIGVNAIHSEHFWPEEYVSRMRLLGEICCGALKRRDAESAERESRLQLQAQLKEIGRLKQKLEHENLYLRKETLLLSEHNEIIAESRQMQDVLLRAEQVARTGSTVLLLGETGTGKELVARHIHKLSTRKGQPMVTVNCASLQPTLIESELFGREKGAYTGAMTKMAGRFEVADGSTIFLDEIGELPLDLQGKLLRVLEEGTFERLGSTRTIHVDVRVITATNRNLLEEVQRGTFRRDLFYRLNVFPITIPPLRDHLDDLAPLVWTFVHQFEKKMGRQIENISQRSMDTLLCHSWPGNIRELRNVIEHAMIISRERTLKVSQPAAAPAMDGQENGVFELEAAEREHILKVLYSCNWRMGGHGGAAEALGLKRTTLQSKMKKLGIRRLAN